jgi:hypothetical protein
VQLVAPTAVLKKPAGHWLQLAVLGTAVNLPTSHMLQEELPAAE